MHEVVVMRHKSYSVIVPPSIASHWSMQVVAASRLPGEGGWGGGKGVDPGDRPYPTIRLGFIFRDVAHAQYSRCDTCMQMFLGNMT